MSTRMTRVLLVALLFLGALILPIVAAEAATVTVDCRTPFGRIGKVLAVLNPQGPNTIHVFGTCRENVVIRGFDRLLLVAHQEASIQDASGGQQPVLEVRDSRRVGLRGFRIVGGSLGVMCFDASLCRFSNNTIEGAADVGVWLSSSQGSFSGDTIQDVGGVALSFDASIVDAWNLTVQRCGNGIFVSNGSVLTGSELAVTENQGDGIGVDTQAHLVLSNSTVSGNGGVGVNLSNQSQALLGDQDAITENGIFGVGIGDLSQVYFSNVTLSDNPTDISCYGRFSVATNLEGAVFGSEECEE